MNTPSTNVKTSEVFEQEDKARIERIRSDIAVRLQKACSHLAREEFAALVDRMTSVQIGGESRAR